MKTASRQHIEDCENKVELKKFFNKRYGQIQLQQILRACCAVFELFVSLFLFLFQMMMVPWYTSRFYVTTLNNLGHEKFLCPS